MIIRNHIRNYKSPTIELYKGLVRTITEGTCWVVPISINERILYGKERKHYYTARVIEYA